MDYECHVRKQSMALRIIRATVDSSGVATLGPHPRPWGVGDLDCVGDIEVINTCNRRRKKIKAQKRDGECTKASRM